MNFDLNLELVRVIRFKFQRRSFIKSVLAVVRSITNVFVILLELNN